MKTLNAQLAPYGTLKQKSRAKGPVCGAMTSKDENIPPHPCRLWSVKDGRCRFHQEAHLRP